MKIAVIMTNGIANVAAAVSLLLSNHTFFFVLLKTTEPAKQPIIVMYENVLTAVKKILFPKMK